MPKNDIRPEIQGLRAAAVLLVLAFHLFPDRVPGGYVGVDVFFVLSGYLITAHLMREHDVSGGISLSKFWARRARRLLPASLFVLASVAVATFAVVPRGLWERYFSEIAASGLYFQNWLLATNSVDYLAANNSPSPVQHFWSLSAEEQFYLLWPVLIAGAIFFARRSTPKVRRLSILLTLLVATLASFIFSLILTNQVPSAAYFITPTRAWEFGAGALLVFAPAMTKPSMFSPALAWIGISGIAFAAFFFDATTAFPGGAALVPVLGAIAAIWGGGAQHWWSVRSVTRWRPIQYVGDISYSLYLWHWPLIVLVPFVTLAPLSTLQKIAVLAITFVLAGVTKRFVEDPIRRAPLLTARKPRWSFAAAVAGMTIVAILCASGISAGLALSNPSPPAAPYGDECFGAAATNPDADCPIILPPDWAAAAAFARADTADPGAGVGETRPCETGSSDGSRVYECRIGNFDDPARTVALIGDSHAHQYDAALARISEDLHWNVLVYVRSACAGTGDESIYFRPRPWDAADCAAWGQKVIRSVVENPEVDAVFVNAYADKDAYVTGGTTEGSTQSAIGPEPYIAMWDKFISVGKEVIVLSDTPKPIGNVPECVELQKAIDPCSVASDTALPHLVMKEAAERMDSPSITFVDLASRFCFAGECPPVIGGVVVYYDDSHLTKTYSRTLGPFIEDALSLAPN